ncbi:Conserved hypothetical protein [Salinibacter ruber M8]|uniref:Uncharacterized protein n=1 Tax=Salinibacter ruber (strain M8) TaxID=761659 RepID=D5H8P1_SALRM|nr:Conserved hypothetical protein [Salinibacter ruber M8]
MFLIFRTHRGCRSKAPARGRERYAWPAVHARKWGRLRAQAVWTGPVYHPHQELLPDREAPREPDRLHLPTEVGVDASVAGPRTSTPPPRPRRHPSVFGHASERAVKAGAVVRPGPTDDGAEKDSGKAACGGLRGAVWPEMSRTHNHLRKRLAEGTGRPSPSAHSGPLRQTRRVNYPIW